MQCPERLHESLDGDLRFRRTLFWALQRRFEDWRTLFTVDIVEGLNISSNILDYLPRASQHNKTAF